MKTFFILFWKSNSLFWKSKSKTDLLMLRVHSWEDFLIDNQTMLEKLIS